MSNETFEINGKNITVIRNDKGSFICLTAIVEAHSGGNGNGTIDRWLSNKNTIEYLGAWEYSENANFNYPEFMVIRNESGVNRFNLSVKRWVESTGAIGIEARPGKYGGTFAHEDIAMEFCTWLDPIFKLAVIKEFKRLRQNEARILGGQWDVRRFVSKVNFKIQTDAVKDVLIPATTLPVNKQGIIYAEASDIIYMAMFGYTSAQWREKNPELAKKGLNIRDVADTHQLIVLANLEVLDSALLTAGITKKSDRVIALRKEALKHVKSLRSSTDLQHKLIESPLLAEQKKIANTDVTEKKTPDLKEAKFGSLLGAVARAGKPDKD